MTVVRDGRRPRWRSRAPRARHRSTHQAGTVAAQASVECSEGVCADPNLTSARPISSLPLAKESKVSPLKVLVTGPLTKSRDGYVLEVREVFVQKIVGPSTAGAER